MSTLMINGREVPVRVVSGSMEIADHVAVTRRWSGDLTYTRRGTPAGIVGHLRELEVEVRSGDPWDRQDVLDLHAELILRDWQSVSGDLWGEASEAEARDVERRDGPLGSIATLRFTLHERGPDDAGGES